MFTAQYAVSLNMIQLSISSAVPHKGIVVV
jgi:hypothetical protein